MSAAHDLLSFGTFELNLATEELRKSGMLIKLAPQPFQLLVMLVSHPGQLVTREAIHNQLWSADSEVDSEHGMRQCIAQIRTALGDNADSPRFVETVPRRGYRFLAPVHSKTVVAPQPRVEKSDSSGIESNIASRVLARIEASAAASGARIPESTPAVSIPSSQSGRRIAAVRTLAACAALLISVAGVLYWRARKASALTEKDTIVLAEFDNKTGDPVFDGTLRQGLSSQLEQSPFLNLLSDQRIGEVLSLMAQPKDAQLTGALAREVCQRTASSATIEGSISALGSQYVIGLKAVDCHNGDLLTDEQVTAGGKEHVLKALGNAATKLRQRLGESLASVQKYDAPADDATTSSLEALQAYSLAYQAMVLRSDYPAANPLFLRAIDLDPNFAMAYARLGTNYGNLGETARAAENLGIAYQLRERVSEREKFYIESHYEQLATGNLEAARKTCELWEQTYPRDSIPPDTLSYIYTSLGDYDNAVAAAQKRLKLAPASALSYGSLIMRYLNLNRLDEAKATAQEAQAHNLDAPLIRLNLYLLDFLEHDTVGMKRVAAGLMGKPGREDEIIYYESDTAAYTGQFVKARELTRLAADSAQRAEKKETAALYVAEAALRDAIAGNPTAAQRQAQRALSLSDGKDAVAMSAIALALAGDSARATQLSADLATRFPEDTIVQFNYLPTIRAATGLTGANAAGAIEALAPAAPYEMGGAPFVSSIVNFTFYAVFLRGEAYLAARQGAPAAAEFQKILDHRGVVVNEPIGALAHLGLARACMLQGDSAKARTKYKDFLALWKDADPDIPIYKQAKAEYAKLQ